MDDDMGNFRITQDSSPEDNEQYYGNQELCNSNYI